MNLVRRSSVKAKTQTINQIRALLVSAPQAIRDAAYKPDAAKCVAACAELSQDSVSAALASLQTALRLLAKRWMVQEGRDGGNRSLPLCNDGYGKICISSGS